MTAPSGRPRASGSPMCCPSALAVRPSARCLWPTPSGNPSSDPMKVDFIDNTDPDGIARILHGPAGRLHETLCIVISKSGARRSPAMPCCWWTRPSARRSWISPSMPWLSPCPARNSTAPPRRKAGSRRFPDVRLGRRAHERAVGSRPRARGASGARHRRFACRRRGLRRSYPQHDLRTNPAALMALMWYHATGGKGTKDMVVLPYKDRLLLFSRYLQQLVMESLGKQFDLQGRRVNQGLSVYGNKGSTDQHAYVQQLREGVPNFFAVFIRVLESGGSASRGGAGRHGRRLSARLLARHARGAVRERPRVDDHHGPARRRPDRGRADRAVRARGGAVRQPDRHQRLSSARRRGRQEGGCIDPGLARKSAFRPFRNAPDRRRDRIGCRCPRRGRDSLLAPGASGGQRPSPLQRNLALLVR